MKAKILKRVLTTIFTIAFIALIIGALSWIATCGLIFLITLCFDIEFSWLIATGLWLGMILVGGLFCANVTVKK